MYITGAYRKQIEEREQFRKEVEIKDRIDGMFLFQRVKKCLKMSIMFKKALENEKKRSKKEQKMLKKSSKNIHKIQNFRFNECKRPTNVADDLPA
jgi:hypothetical protein